MPGQQQIHNISELLQRWRIDLLEFLRSDAPKIVLVLLVAFILIRLLHVVTRRLTDFTRRQDLAGLRSQQLRTLASVINGVGLFIVLFVAAMQILPVVGINIGPLLASAGIAGLAIGFGAQTLVKDVINGFFILMENQYDIGDVVKVAGVTGTVEYMTLRRTVVRDADGSLHTVPNSQINVVSNLTRDWTQTALHMAVSYQEDSDRIIGLLKEVAQEIRNDPAFADALVGDLDVPGIERIAPGEVVYLMLVKTKPGAQYGVMRELRRRIKVCFEKNHVQAAGPVPIYVLNESPTARPK
ncbi:MAG: mechanosensitive ion channel family protein [Terriglobales bacterium]